MLILASTSTYRRLLLQRLGLVFETQAPGVDETALLDELPCDLVARLARLKAKSVADSNPTAIVIGSDQLAELNGQVIGKPGDQVGRARPERSETARRVPGEPTVDFGHERRSLLMPCQNKANLL